MKSKNNKSEKLNEIIPSKQISYNIKNKKSKNKYFFFCFIVDQKYKDKVEVSFKHKENIIKPDSLRVKSYDFPEQRYYLFFKSKRFLYFYELEIPNELNELKIILKYNEDNNNFNGKYIERNLNLLINIDISPINLESNIAYKLYYPEEYKKLLECFIEFFSCKDINVKKEFLYKLFLNQKKLYIDNLFLLSKLFDNNYNSLDDKIDAILYFIDNKEIENYQVKNVEMEIISLYNNIKDSKSEKLWYFLIKNLIKMNEHEKALEVILRIKDDKIRLSLMKKISFFVIENIVQKYESLPNILPHDLDFQVMRDLKDSAPSLDVQFLKRLIGKLDYTHIKEDKVKYLENEIDEKVSFISKDNYINYIIEIQSKEKFINNKENKRIKELKKLNIELKQKNNK